MNTDDIITTGKVDDSTRELLDQWWYSHNERLHGADVIAKAKAEDRYDKHFVFTNVVGGETAAIATGLCSIGLGYLKELVVRDDFRGQGIGTALLAKFEQTCRDHQAFRLALRTDATSEAVAFYQHHGWHVEYENRDWFGGHVFYQMRKDLDR